MSSKLIVVSAPSGAGKTTLCQRLLADFPQELVLSISSTTRSPRGSEEHGREYFFLTRGEFEARIRSNDFAEWALVHGNYYGTSKELIQKAFAEGRSVLLDIDVQGAASLALSYPQECFRIFISPPNLTTLEARLRARATDNEETIQKRLKNAQQEMAHLDRFDKVVINDHLDHAHRQLKDLIGPLLKKT